MAAPDHALIVWMLTATLSVVVILGIVAAFVVMHLRYRQHVAMWPKKEAINKSDVGTAHSLYLAWNKPTCWIAIRNHNLQAVQSALALHNSKPCTWVEGLAGDSEKKLFISPPVSGWILVIGPMLPDPADDVDICYRLLADLSRKLGHVQFFSANTMVHHHAWVQAENGRILRGYAWAGKTLWNQGDITNAESDLRLKCYDYEETAEAPVYGTTHPAANNSEKVHLLAARWSVDPDEIDERFIEHEWGIVGQRSRLF